MDRSQAIFSIAVATGGVTLLSRCSFGEERLPIALNNLKVTVGEEDLLKEVVDLIIPATDIPGAGELEVHNFVWVMMDDCASEDEQDRFMSGLRGFIGLSDHISEKSYDEMTPEERTSLLADIMARETVEDIPTDDAGNPSFDLSDVQYFLAETKGTTIWGFMQSEYVMKNVMPYSLVPGSSTGCATVDPTKRVNVNG